MLQARVMVEAGMHVPESRLTITSRLTDLAAVTHWIDALALHYALPADTHYAISLCLEEALSNVIRHGYRGEPDHSITLECLPAQEGWLKIVAEDSAPHFSPDETADSMSDQADVPPLSLEDFHLGGQGIRLMRHFAGSLEWEQLPQGNRLTMSFPIQRKATQ